MTLQSVITMEDLQGAADIDSQLAAGSIMNQVLVDQDTRDEMLCDMLDIDSAMMHADPCADLISATHLTTSDVEEEVDVADEEVEQEGDGDIQGGVTSDNPDEYSEGPPRDGKLKKPLLPHEYTENTPPKKKPRRTITSPVWRHIKRLRNKALLGPMLKVGQDRLSQVLCRVYCM